MRRSFLLQFIGPDCFHPPGYGNISALQKQRGMRDVQLYACTMGCAACVRDASAEWAARTTACE